LCLLHCANSSLSTLRACSKNIRRINYIRLKLYLQVISSPIFMTITFHDAAISWTLACGDIKNRYRRSTLGPWWIVISSAIMLLGMGPLYAFLFKISLSSYFPQLSISLILWFFVSQSVTECSSSILAAENDLRYLRVNPDLYILKSLMVNIIILAYNFLIPFLIFSLAQGLPATFLGIITSLPILLLGFTALFFSTKVLAYLSVYFRDIPLLVANLVYLLFFLSPILWTENQLSPFQVKMASLNPLFSFISLVRNSMSNSYDSIPLKLCPLLAFTVISFILQSYLTKRLQPSVRNYI